MAGGKQKTRKAVAKRFTQSGSGKLMREKAARRHRLVPKSSKAKGMGVMQHEVAKGDAKQMRKALAN